MTLRYFALALAAVAVGGCSEVRTVAGVNPANPLGIGTRTPPPEDIHALRMRRKVQELEQRLDDAERRLR